MTVLHELVKEAYENATFNGYDMGLMTEEEVAIDMMTYDAEISDYEFDEVYEAVRLYRSNNAGVV